MSLGELADGWSAHVRRIIDEFDARQEDRTTWGAHDYVAALHLRDAIERGLQMLDESSRAAALDQVAATDQEFSDQTEDDQGTLLSAFLGSSGDAWWWQRIPVRGPIRSEVAGGGTSA